MHAGFDDEQRIPRSKLPASVRVTRLPVRSTIWRLNNIDLKAAQSKALQHDLDSTPLIW